jgi:hypothetical protein
MAKEAKTCSFAAATILFLSPTIMTSAICIDFSTATDTLGSLVGLDTPSQLCLRVEREQHPRWSNRLTRSSDPASRVMGTVHDQGLPAESPGRPCAIRWDLLGVAMTCTGARGNVGAATRQ